MMAIKCRYACGCIDYFDFDEPPIFCQAEHRNIRDSSGANAARFETYAIPGKRGTREIVLNGAAALLGKPGDRLTIMSFTEVEMAQAKSWKPRVIVLGEKNAIIDERGV